MKKWIYTYRYLVDHREEDTFHRELSWISSSVQPSSSSPMFERNKTSSVIPVVTIPRLLGLSMELLLSSSCLSWLPPVLCMELVDVFIHNKFSRACRNLKSLKYKSKVLKDQKISWYCTILIQIHFFGINLFCFQFSYCVLRISVVLYHHVSHEFKNWSSEISLWCIYLLKR